MEIKNIVQKIFFEGYYIYKNVIDSDTCNNYIKAIKKIQKKIKKNPKFKDERSGLGQEIIRDLVLRDPNTFLNLIDNTLVLQVLTEIFRDKFILDNCMASNSVNVKDTYSGLVHIDSHLPCNKNSNTTDVVVLFCLDDFTKNNGATKIWPGSHLSGVRIQNAKNYKNLIKKRNKYVEAKKGSIVFFLGQTWHQIGRNLDNNSRWGILCHYKRWWIKPSTDFTKCGKNIYRMLNKNQKEIFGFNSISPKFNFNAMTKELKTLRSADLINNMQYKEILNY
jgi:ectoine hydroxylase-related dioxygenase (phytanoyl-CoA dioxygenase family)